MPRTVACKCRPDGCTGEKWVVGSGVPVEKCFRIRDFRGRTSPGRTHVDSSGEMGKDADRRRKTLPIHIFTGASDLIFSQDRVRASRRPVANFIECEFAASVFLPVINLVRWPRMHPRADVR